MKNNYNNKTKVIGVIGHPIKHSYSPFIHNVAIELTKLDLIYLSFDVPSSQLKNALNGMIALGILGYNVTIPHKEKIIPYLNFIVDEASVVGAVNTVVNDLGKLTGCNTDVFGVQETLLPYKQDIADENVTVIGAGGAARAVVYALIRYFRPKKIFILNRTEQKADTLKNHFSSAMKFSAIKTGELFSDSNIDWLTDSKLIVNATPVGMLPLTDDTLITSPKAFVKGQIVFDLIYNPSPSKLLQMASAQGAVTIDGSSMFIHQAAKAFELWTGREMPVEAVRSALQLLMKD